MSEIRFMLEETVARSRRSIEANKESLWLTAAPIAGARLAPSEVRPLVAPSPVEAAEGVAPDRGADPGPPRAVHAVPARRPGTPGEAPAQMILRFRTR